MLLAYNWSNVWQSIKDTWLPILSQIAIVMIYLISVSIIRKNKGKYKS